MIIETEADVTRAVLTTRGGGPWYSLANIFVMESGDSALPRPLIK